MRLTRVLWQHRQPSIRFLGKRHTPQNVDHTPHAHPAAPDHSLPESFAQYRGRAIQHGPLGGGQQQQQAPQQRHPQQQTQSRQAASAGTSKSFEVEPYGSIGGHSGRELGSVQPGKGEAWDRDELPARFRRRPWSDAEMDAIDTAGASMWS